MYEDENNFKNDWQAIRLRMNEHKIDPERLAKSTKFSRGDIEAGIGGQNVKIPLWFLRACIRVFRLMETREGSPYTIEDMSYEQCMEKIRPKPAMPQQRDFWSIPDSESN